MISAVSDRCLGDCMGAALRSWLSSFVPFPRCLRIGFILGGSDEANLQTKHTASAGCRVSYAFARDCISKASCGELNEGRGLGRLMADADKVVGVSALSVNPTAVFRPLFAGPALGWPSLVMGLANSWRGIWSAFRKAQHRLVSLCWGRLEVVEWDGCGGGLVCVGRPDSARLETRLRLRPRLASLEIVHPRPELIRALRQGRCRGRFPAILALSFYQIESCC